MDLKKMSENLRAKAEGSGYSNSTEDPGDEDKEGTEAEEESSEKEDLRKALSLLEEAKAQIQKCLGE